MYEGQKRNLNSKTPMKIQLHVTIQVIKVKPVLSCERALIVLMRFFAKINDSFFLFFGSKKVAKMAIIK